MFWWRIAHAEGMLKGLLMLIAISILIISGTAYAATGWCKAQQGNHIYNYDFGTYAITDPAQNAAGTTLKNIFSWSLNGSFTMDCDCPDTYKGLYYHTVTPLPVGHSDGTLQYYKLDDYLEVATEAWIAGRRNQYVPTPWNNEPNNDPGSYTCTDIVNVSTGSKGRMTLYISKPFINGVYIISKKVFELYGSTISGSFGGESISSVYINGTITVPQNCRIDAGKRIEVDFGEIYSGEFVTKGEKPLHFTPKIFNVPIECTDTLSAANLSLSIQGTTSAGDSNALKSDNADVGVIVLDMNSHVLIPNNMNSSVKFTLDSNYHANIQLSAYPVNVTGNAPTEGVFTALAFLRIDFA